MAGPTSTLHAGASPASDPAENEAGVAFAGQSKVTMIVADMETGNLNQWPNSATPTGPGSVAIDSGSTPSPHGGTYQAKLQIGGADDYSMGDGTDASAIRNRLDEWDYAPSLAKSTPDEVYWSAWFYIPAYYAFDNPHDLSFYNWTQTKQLCYDDYPTNSSTTKVQVATIHLIGAPNSTKYKMRLSMDYEFDGASYPRNPSNGLLANSDWDVPIATWFHIEWFWRWATDATGIVKVWADGHKVFDVEGIVTEMTGQHGVYDFDIGEVNEHRQWTINMYGKRWESAAGDTVNAYLDDAYMTTYAKHGADTGNQGGTAPMVIGRQSGAKITSSSTLTGSHYLQQGANRRVFIISAYDDTNNGTVSSVTYGGVSATLCTDGTTTARAIEPNTSSVSNTAVEIWEVKEADLPADDTEHDVVTTWSESVVEGYQLVIMAENCDQSTNLNKVEAEGFNPVQGDNTTQITTTGGVGAGVLIIDGVGFSDSHNILSGEDQSSFFGNAQADSKLSNGMAAYSFRREADSGTPSESTYDMTWNAPQNSSRMAHAIIAVREA
jgi:hypothetical protein